MLIKMQASKNQAMKEMANFIGNLKKSLLQYLNIGF